jgi:hypothetical protein
MTGLTVTALAVGIAGSVVSRSIVLDAIALWPVAVLALPAAILGIKGGRRRALTPMILISWLLVTVGLHLGGVSGLPSAAAAVRADLGSAETARLTVAVPGLTLELTDGPFAVVPVPVGGEVGVPVVERVAGSTAAALVVTEDRTRSPWFRFGAYRIGLPDGVGWDIRIDVAAVDLDLSAVEITGGRIEAATGRVELGSASSAVTLAVAGDIEVAVPDGVAVRVIGSTRVPDGWTVTEEGATAPSDGDGWIIQVDEGSVRIVTR